MKPAASTAIPPADGPNARRRWTELAALGIAAAALMARDSRSNAALPTAVIVVCQLPLLFAWLRGTIGRRSSSPIASIDIVVFAVVAITGIGLSIGLGRVSPALIASTGYVAGVIAIDALARLHRRIEQSLDAPGRLLRVVAGPWLALILVAAIILALPIAMQAGVPDYRHNFASHIVSSLHTAVGAACLVGSFAFSFADDYTTFGQSVIIALTQFSGFVFAAIGLSLVRPILHRPPSLRRVYIAAVFAQLAGVAILFTAWRTEDAPTMIERLWWSIVHAGSALWNTGIMMRPDGLASYFADRRVFLTITSLAIAGSLGIPILFELLGKKPPPEVLATNRLGRMATFDAFAALVILLLLTVVLFYFENPASVFGDWRPALPFEPSVNQPAMRDNRTSPWPLAVLVASTVRSAGLQSIPVSVGTLSWPSLVLLAAAMFIGGSLAGTSGGIRTSLFGLLLVRPQKRDIAMAPDPDPIVSRRRIVVKRFLWGLVGWLAMNWIGTLLLGLTTSAARYDTTFDAIASLNNVGLSTGLVHHLTTPGRLVAIVLMLVGRLWPLWFWATTMTLISQQTTQRAESDSASTDDSLRAANR
ncbi:MAG: hypothetical protein H6818_21665 [Phycisphaerales bacterium]|nr:hypothetical protein [Phycisphaerales bacterium]MCB9862399.1 hypothetical protein [Phycisphaerales bacterium]